MISLCNGLYVVMLVLEITTPFAPSSVVLALSATQPESLGIIPVVIRT